ncbi:MULTISPECIES: hypothetical protein [Bacillus]|uniref:hypothetical protein n=1 Tax=Bacillus TaxID=1386 RepID=UPI000D03F0E5|nr:MULTISPECIES: hypothetical protein [Bacillus]MCY7679872.1 hypothetical protein [Bacillus pumilus]PRS47505.1 hypothetical protein C6Y06_18310 [Bacillus sp. MZGC1]
MKYFANFNFVRIGEFSTLKEAQQEIGKHQEFFKSKYTKKGTPKSSYSQLKRFAISDNNGDLYYIY